jgi:hypothetical protein
MKKIQIILNNSQKVAIFNCMAFFIQKTPRL